ncbi:hypothetical protein DEU56DRAFT_441315 [Suillus clintonianus]|uniref:uncharacterized protein n=1 Tax=Suillus clintonianus TaxID=1904413 RepID=UPI001B873A00|nr:uncharacterized protein DEU56DRAFT_441315 [Suillus clintonianus]KAG2132800.1 hypothetical protein DEU56DRAFT_441315 [Suillus clintonianus]
MMLALVIFCSSHGTTFLCVVRPLWRHFIRWSSYFGYLNPSPHNKKFTTRSARVQSGRIWTRREVQTQSTCALWLPYPLFSLLPIVGFNTGFRLWTIQGLFMCVLRMGSRLWLRVPQSN